MTPLRKLFSPIRIGNMEVRNRIAMAPVTTGWAPADGTFPERMIDYFEERAKGGVGLIMCETVTVDKAFPYIMQSIGLWSDELIPSFKRFVDAVHAHGAKVAPQISHPGPESFSFLKGIQPVGPSPILCKLSGQMCRELAIEEIGPIVEQYGEAARRAREAGCDAIELHAAHSYMLAGSFLSPLRNRRTDAYGGTADGRLRFLLDVLASIESKAGRDLPVILRLSGDEYLPGGRDLRDTQYIAPKLADAGVDAFEVSAGVEPELMWRIIPPMGTPLGLNLSVAAAIKQVVNVPVMVVGRVNDPRLAEDMLRNGRADMVVMGRALVADPELPNKAAEGRFEDIVPCTGCSMGCVGEQMKLRTMTCVINPTVGREKEMAIVSAAKPKKVLVAGGGPGGLEAARVAAIRGHDVTLCEKEAKLGGQLNLACVAPMKQEISLWIQYLAVQVKKRGVKVRLNQLVTPDFVDEMKPDVLIVSTGGRAVIPPIPGADGAKVIHAHEILAGKLGIMRGNVVVIGGGVVGCEVADVLADSAENPMNARNAITIVEMLDDIAIDEVPSAKMLLVARLREKGVRTITSATVKEITEDGVVITRGGKEETLGGLSHIVLSCGTKPVDDLSSKINGTVPEVYVIGDAKEARSALEAIAEGAEIARKI